MARSQATSAEDYLAELPEDRRRSIARVRDVVREHLPDGYRETMSFGMISWGIPLETYPDTYNGQPLCYAALASNKNNMTLYLMGAYADPKQRARLEQAYAKKGKRLDMGKSCLHFKSADELPLDLIGELIEARPPADYIALMESNRSTARTQRKTATAGKTAARKAAPKKGGTTNRGTKKSALKNGTTARKAIKRKPAKRR